MKISICSARQLFAALFLFLTVIAPPVSAQRVYSPIERQSEEARIRKEIAANLDWHNRTPETLDEVPDSDRMLYGRINESILLKQATGERFGIYESFDEVKGTKTIEIRLHRKNKLTDRFELYGDGCESTGIEAQKVAPKFVLYTTSCLSSKYGAAYLPLLFDMTSRNFYLLAALDYDRMENKTPSVLLENDVYKMRWNVRLRGNKKTTFVVRNFRILKNAKGDWIVKELPPIDDEAANVQPLKKLSIESKYDLPIFAASNK